MCLGYMIQAYKNITKAIIQQPGLTAKLVTAIFTTTACLTATGAYADDALRIVGFDNPVNVYLTVESLDGTPVPNLTAGDFVLLENGASQAITQVSKPGVDNIAIVFVMDYSGSMYEANAIAPMESAAMDFVSRMRPSDSAAIIKFNGDIGVVVTQDFTSDKALLNTAITTVPGGSEGTNLYDAIKVAAELFSRNNTPIGSRAIIALTDGADSHSTTTLSALSPILNDNSASLFAISLGLQLNTTALDNVALRSGGHGTRITSPEVLGEVYNDIQTSLVDQYLIEYNSAITSCSPQTVVVQTTTPDGPVSYTGSLSRCAPAASGGAPVNNSEVNDKYKGSLSAAELMLFALAIAALLLRTGKGFFSVRRNLNLNLQG